MKFMRMLMVVGSLLLLLGVLGGCLDRAEQARDTAQAVGDDARERVTELQTSLADAQAALEEARRLGLEAEARRLGGLASALEGEIAVTEATVAAADAAVAQANELIAEARAAEGLFEQVPLLNLLPPPYREGVAMIGTIGVFLWRNQKLRGAATSIIKSLEVARKDDPAVDEAIRRHAQKLRAEQSATAKRLVDEVQTKRRPLLPV